MEKKTGNRRLCRRCLLREMADQEEYFRSLKDYIDNMDPDIRAAEQLYEERLAICRACEMLLQGMCRKCGCYVELRAAVARNVCPWGKWKVDNECI
ncbi:MAG: DUF6171 family protein [Lachnospiraceae bacterium]|nr:DUF6171 family protein [Butyrivibrio sp.]MCM1344930.1 DUF6171 family protein [Muribaculaceae bacterium]MCM1412076.1 DUF6171 family protein [Lachnospiraceae bacterium]